MGEEARWVCHDCKTVCSRGGRPWLRVKLPVTRERVSQLRDLLSTVSLGAELDDHIQNVYGFLSDLNVWLSRHEDHNFHIGSDYTTDMMDLDEYHNETVRGEVSDYTRLEAEQRTADEWRERGTEKIAGIIMSCKSKGAYGSMIDVKAAAEKLYDQFCFDMAAEIGG